MVEVLLGKEEITSCRNIVNDINNIDTNIRVYKILVNKKEIFKILEKNKVDILLIDYDIFKKLSALEFVILSNKLKSIFIINNENLNTNIKSDRYIFIKENEIVDNLKRVIMVEDNINMDSNTRKSIINELSYLGYNMSYHGTKYLIESIDYIYKLEKKGIWEWSLMRNIYPEVAKIYGKDVNNIKCNIVRATDKMFYECEEKRLIEYLKFLELSKPGPKMVIDAVLNKIHNN